MELFLTHKIKLGIYKNMLKIVAFRADCLLKKNQVLGRDTSSKITPLIAQMARTKSVKGALENKDINLIEFSPSKKAFLRKNCAK